MSKSTTPLSGLLLIDKPAGITSHDAVLRVRKIVRESAQRVKVGHAGTLDPFATGLLLVLVGSATRLSEYLLPFSKRYDATITLGATSNTDDCEGIIRPPAEPAEVPAEESVKKVVQSFVGTSQQVPPAFAAIKVRGKKLYDYARAGKAVERKSRTITINRIKLLSYHYPTLHLLITCSSGTYIRALARDIGAALGTGGYLSALRRMATGSFEIQDALPLRELSTTTLQNALLPPHEAVRHLPHIMVTRQDIIELQEGRPIAATSLPEGKIALLTEENELLGIGNYDSSQQLLAPDKILKRN